MGANASSAELITENISSQEADYAGGRRLHSHSPAPSSHSSDGENDAEELVAKTNSGQHGSWGALAKDAALVARKRRIMGDVEFSDSEAGDVESDSGSGGEDPDGEATILSELRESPWYSTASGSSSCNMLSMTPPKASEWKAEQGCLSSPATATPTLTCESLSSGAESSSPDSQQSGRSPLQTVQSPAPACRGAKGGKGASAPPLPPLAKGKAKGSSSEPIAGQGKGGCGKGPPLRSKGAGKESAAVKAGQMRRTNTDPVALPIGRRLSLRPATLDAVVFRSLAKPDTPTGTPTQVASPTEAGEEEDDSGDAPAMQIDRSLCLGAPLAVNPSQVDFSALRDAFAPSASSSTPKFRVAKSSAVELLSRKVAQNLGILFLSSKVDTAQLARSIIQLDPEVCPFNQEELQRLLAVWPSPEDLAPLLRYSEQGSDPAALRDVERQLLPLVRIPRLAQRCRCVMLLRFLGDRLTEALNRIATVRVACRELQSSTVLRSVLSIILVLFNYTNFGKEADNPEGLMRGVDVLSLLKLRDTKAYQGDFPGFNMLHFVVKQLVQQQPHLKSAVLQQEFRRLPKAVGQTLDSMHKELKQLQSDLSFVTGELHNHGKEYGVIPRVPVGTSPDDAWALGQGFLGTLLGTGMDLVGCADAWMRGTEVLGGVRSTYAEAEGFGLVLGEDRRPSPPGWLWLLRPSGRWLKCWCEVRSSVLIIYKVRGKRCSGARFIALPTSEVAAFDTLPTSDLPGSLLAAAPHGFEINNRSASQLVRLRASHQTDLNRWLGVLNAQSKLPGYGFLMIHQNGRPLLGGSMGWFYCCLHEGHLLAFARPRHGVEGFQPRHIFRIAGSEAVPLGSECVSDDARDLAADLRFGFEVIGCGGPDDELDDGWQFVCESSVEESEWVSAIMKASAAADGAAAGSLEDACPATSLVPYIDVSRYVEQEFTTSSLFDFDNDMDAPDDQSCGDDSDDEARKENQDDETPRHQLETLEQSLTEAVELWSSSLAAAEDDCRGLLQFFGIKEPTQPQMLSDSTAQLLQALATFVVELRHAWEDVQRHQEGVRLKKKADARSSTLTGALSRPGP
eukprot:CAMPEP_0178394348 /NCGR_PEP_ID=MMETSP0689_2-20121128/12660_1 /TAXON_ID=160604 /ORGANISM="Amphidinium massartii, Strain CS-259" /LENGTH=1075 /DNA_ID=CAMNT_0020014975 /DNA_START=96 /DNA_END=3319 /DNA_ORIENTATION=+